MIKTIITAAMLTAVSTSVASAYTSNYHFLTAWTDSDGHPFIKHLGTYDDLSDCNRAMNGYKGRFSWRQKEIDHGQHKGLSNGYKTTIVCREVRQY